MTGWTTRPEEYKENIFEQPHIPDCGLAFDIVEFKVAHIQYDRAEAKYVVTHVKNF